ncbi:MAG: ferritin-like domain-containing protein [Candidatus Rokubacteria bacterium]|nr:ferritin-like domain-containing protein [Candidatus Rokubacteria bacterium]
MDETHPDLSSLPRGRRLILLEGLGEALGLERELAALYDRLASSLPPTAPVELVAELARETEAHGARVAALIVALGGHPPPPASAAGPGTGSRGDLYSRVFQAERSLLAGYRDLVALLPDPAVLPPLVTLVGDEGRHLNRLLDLYRRYS